MLKIDFLIYKLSITYNQMRINLKIYLLSLMLLPGCNLSGVKQNQEKPNFIFIMMDDLGYSQVGFNSEGISSDDYDTLLLQFTLRTGDYDPEKALEFSRRASPTLSRMAKEGVIFTNAFSPCNLCAPSRIAIATGIMPNRLGIYRNIDTEARGPDQHSLLVEKLQEAGYATAHIGKWHLARRDSQLFFRFMKKYGFTRIPENARQNPDFRQMQKELADSGFTGSVNPEQNPLNNGFDYYYGYNTWESPFYNANNVWEGFRHLEKNPVYNTDLFTEKAMGFIEQSVEEGKPFYVQLHYHAVHSPLEPKAPDNYYNKFDSESFVLNNFYAHINAVDENILRIENFLKEKGKAENTLFVFTSDNGGAVGGRSCMPGNAPYRGHKGMYLMGGIKVPFIFYWPEGIKKPNASKMLVSTFDILPTALDAAGCDLPEMLDGKSLLPLLKGTSDTPVRDYLIHSGIHARTWGFMNETTTESEGASRDHAPASWTVIKDGLILRYISETDPGMYTDLPDGLPAHYELYNYESDPGERINLIGNYPEKVKELKAIWEKEAVSFPPPVKWRRDRWEAIVPADNKYIFK